MFVRWCIRVLNNKRFEQKGTEKAKRVSIRKLRMREDEFVCSWKRKRKSSTTENAEDAEGE